MRRTNFFGAPILMTKNISSKLPLSEPKKKQSKTGSLAANFHEGSRSEYLAQYALSSLGMAALLPRQEDVGVDLHCALGERVGQRLVIDQYYSVQVKSTSASWLFEGTESVEWLCAHRHPLFFVRVTKASNTLDIFHTAALVLLHGQAIESVELIPGGAPPTFTHPGKLQDKLALHLGPPILSFNASRTADESWRKSAKSVLRSWIALDQENIDAKITGMTLFGFPSSYKTNSPAKVDAISGNFKIEFTSDAKHVAASNAFIKYLTLCAHRAGSELDVQSLNAVIQVTRDYVQPRLTSIVTTGLMLHLISAINTAAAHVGLPAVLKIVGPDGKELAPILTVEG